MRQTRIRGIGVDAVAIDRMDSQRMGMHVLTRMFSDCEVQEALCLDDSMRGEFLASRFAAKEAFVKALGTGFRGIAPKDIAVVVDAVGKPSLAFTEGPRLHLSLDSLTIHLSLTHERNLAIAFVVLEELDGTF